jgi:hypothetical protein
MIKLMYYFNQRFVMPKVLVAGEKALVVHSFSEDELNKIEISETRNDSVVKIGKAFDQANLTEEMLNSVKPSIIMLLKQSNSFKLMIENSNDLQAYVLAVFKGKTINGRKNYIANWIGKMSEDALTQNPQALVPEMLKGFQSYLNLSDFHKKSTIHQLINS